MKSFMILGLSLGLVLAAADASAQVVAHGATEYKLCASCHGFKGEGNQLVNAPALGGQEGWYLTRQIQNFRSGVRGSASGDGHGKVMSTMAQGLGSDTEVANLVAYIEKLPVNVPAVTIDADTEQGRTLYNTCAACHGDRAQGNEALNAPSLAMLDDWYQVRQLQAFKNGHRGSNPEDTYGQQMRPMASMLADEQAMRNVVAYIASLK